MVTELHTQNFNRNELRAFAISQLRLYKMLGFDSASVYWSRLVTRLNKSKAKTIRPKTVGLPLRHAREGVLLAVLLIGLATSCKPYMVISRHYVQDKRGNVLYVKDHSDTLLHPMRRKKFKSLQ